MSRQYPSDLTDRKWQVTHSVVERTLSWFGTFRRFKLYYQRSGSHLQAFDDLAPRPHPRQQDHKTPLIVKQLPSLLNKPFSGAATSKRRSASWGYHSNTILRHFSYNCRSYCNSELNYSSHPGRNG
jgi:hypothetical protein